MKRSSPLKRGKLLNKVNSSRARRRRAKAFGDKAAWVRQRPCAVRSFDSEAGRTDCFPSCLHVEAAHTKSRGAGGDSTHLIPLCTRHHAEQHTLGKRTFEARYDISMDELAAHYEAGWQILVGEENRRLTRCPPPVEGTFVR